LKIYEYILRRLILIVFVVFAVSIIVFLLGRAGLPPGSAVASYITSQLDDSQKLGVAQSVGVATSSCPSWTAFVDRQSGCEVPIYQQYFSWLHNVLSGNWGYSLIPGVSAGTGTYQLFTSRFPYTVELAISASIISVIIGVPLGIVAAVNRNKPQDHISRIISLLGYSMPAFWLGYLLQLVFYLYISIHSGNFSYGLLPASGALSSDCALCFRNPGQIKTYTGFPLIDSLFSGNFPYFWDSIVAMILPSITLALSILGSLTRVIRASMIDALKQDYIILARSKGLRERTVVYRHALKNAVLPALTIAGYILGALLGGVVVTEFVFSWPGVGQVALQAALYDDINFLELYALVCAAIIMITNLGVDVAYSVIDPRIRY
jgi:peptide/nickel transport system permease protein